MLKNPLYLIKGVLGRTFYIFPQRPERIQIEITNRCNYTCGMCPRESFNLPEKDIPLDLFKKIIDRLETPYNVTLTGWGEPLLHPALMDMIVYTKDKAHNVGITTNGLLLSPFVEKFIEKSLDKLTISLDSVEKEVEVKECHPSNKAVQRNIESLIRSRGDKKKPMITIQITMHGKKQCLETVRYAGEVGSDRVYLVRLNIPFGMNSFKRPSLEEEMEIYKESEEIAKNMDCRLTTISQPLIINYFGLCIKNCVL